MPQPSLRSYIGIGKETTPGTAVAATHFIPVSTMTPKDDITYLVDQGMRGSMVSEYDTIAGVKVATYDFDGDAFPDTLGFLLTGVLGDLTTTGASAPFSHAMAVLNTGDAQPPSYTISDYYAMTGAATTRRYAGMKFSEVGLKWAADGLLTYSAKATGYASATATNPTPTYSAVTPMAAWIGVISIGGSVVNYVTDAECTIKRPADPIHTGDGSADPYKIFAGPVTVEGKFTAVMEDDTELTRYLTNTKPALDMSFQQGAAAALTQVLLHMTKCAYTAAEVGRGKDYVEISVTYKGLANTTDVGASAGYSPIKATLQNAIAASVYK
jgi:hypothetical protein